MPRPVAPRDGGEEYTFPGSDAYKAITFSFHPVEGCPDTVAQVTRWTFSAIERAKVASGEDVYVRILRPADGLVTPVAVDVGVPVRA